MKRTSWLFLIPALFFSLFNGHQAQAQERKGWSPQGKGAAIGGAAGILGGALINKRNRVVGGAIGGAVGAGAGYAIGKHVDNKQKKAAALAAERAAANQRVAAANARAVAAERQAAARRTGMAPVAAAAVGAAAAQSFASNETTVSAGYLPNPEYGQTGTAYPESEVRRKSW